MKKTVLIHATRIHGEIEEGKPYTSGRLYLGVYPDGAQVPAYTYVQKCRPDLVSKIAPETGKAVNLYFDQYKNVIGFDVG